MDFAGRPWAYPGRGAATAGILQDGVFSQRRPAELFESATAGRTAVVAIGSNATPSVVHRKLSTASVSTTVAFFRASLAGIAPGHSAHVSRLGYIPAAPCALDSLTPVTVSWFTAEQLIAIDETELNYVRRLVPAGWLDVVAAPTPAVSWVYDSAWGVLGVPPMQPLTARPQHELFALLAEQWHPFAELAGPVREPAELMAVLGADESLRMRWREAFADSGWALESGLERWPTARRRTT